MNALILSSRLDSTFNSDLSVKIETLDLPQTIMQLPTLVKVEGTERECYDPLAGVIVLLPAEMPRCHLLLSTSSTASGRVYSSGFAIILLYIRTEIPQSDKISKMPRHYDSSRTLSILLVLLALLTQETSAIRWSSPQAGDVISPGDMILAAWYAFLILEQRLLTPH